MEENNENHQEDLKVPESPKPLAFTVDFGEGRSVDTQRHKTLVEKFKKKHRRGQSLSKIDDSPPSSLTVKKHPLTGNLPRKSSFQSEGYFSSDEKSDRAKRGNSAKRSELSLPLKNVISDKMTQSVPNAKFFNNTTPEIELKDISSPELDPISPFTPIDKAQNKELPITTGKNNLLRQYSSPECETQADHFIEATEFDFDKSDTVSDAGTYTLDAENYSEEQKARMSIDAEFKIELVSDLKKTADYVKSLGSYQEERVVEVVTSVEEVNVKCQIENNGQSPVSPKPTNKFGQRGYVHKSSSKMLSPILSPTQNLSITQSPDEGNVEKLMNNGGSDLGNKTFTRIMFPSLKAKGNGLEQLVDQGSVISVTSSGVFRSKNEPEKPNVRKLNLMKSEIHVEAYVDDKVTTNEHLVRAAVAANKAKKLTANIVNVQSISEKSNGDCEVVTANLVLGKVSNLPPSGKASPTKIPSPLHTISRPRSRSSVSSFNVDLSDSSLETESYLKPTQNCINSLQQRLSLDSDQESDYDMKLQLNNSPHILSKQKATHTRHNSLDEKAMKISNKLEHFQSKNLQGIDQTYMFNQYNQNKVIHKIQNSPNNSPIRRSSSFSTKNQIATKNTNIAIQKESNLRNSPNLTSIQRSASTANIKPNYIQLRRSSINCDHQKIDRSQYGESGGSSSEDDFEKVLAKKKDLSNLTNTRYNRAFSLRRGRLDEPVAVSPRCPNTPEMRRKFQPEHARAISVDRKPVKTNEVQSRYLLNVTKKSLPIVAKIEPPKFVPKGGAVKATPSKPTVFSRTDSGRFSMRTNSKPPATGAQKNTKKDGSGKKSGGRSNSSLSSREKEFQNWKRRKSYDPMKAAAEGKRKELMAKKANVMTQSFNETNQDCDSSPSHSSSVHRSQSFHGTAALEQLISSEEEDDLTLSADEGFSPPTPSPCELSPARASLRNWRDHILH